MPKRAEVVESQAPQAGYTKYWRSLPKFKPSPLLEEVQRAPYFKVRNWSNAAHLLPGQPVVSGKKRRYQSVCHHKTGQNLENGIRWILPQDQFEISETCEGMLLEPVWRRLHMVRDPVDVILSGYRYHQAKWGSEVWSWGGGRLDQDPACFMCDNDDHRVMFDSCRFNCTYFELVNRLPELAGVVTEAVSARVTITSMASLMSLTGGRDDTLHLSFNLFKANYEQASRCVLKFLGLEGDEKLFAKVLKAVKTVKDPHHVTSSLYNNTAMKAYLRNHPVWGPEFREVKQLMKRVFRRQARRWGCPEQEAGQ